MPAGVGETRARAAYSRLEQLTTCHDLNRPEFAPVCFSEIYPLVQAICLGHQHVNPQHRKAQ